MGSVKWRGEAVKKYINQTVHYYNDHDDVVIEMDFLLSYIDIGEEKEREKK